MQKENDYDYFQFEKNRSALRLIGNHFRHTGISQGCRPDVIFGAKHRKLLFHATTWRIVGTLQLPILARTQTLFFFTTHRLHINANETKAAAEPHHRYPPTSCPRHFCFRPKRLLHSSPSEEHQTIKKKVTGSACDVAEVRRACGFCWVLH